jgi:glycerol-3-phosphate acyltransferase PlsY
MIGALAVVIAYLVGGIPFGLLIVKLMTGKDVRQSGSGNIGATNVLRTTGFMAGFLTLLLDAAKGWVSVWLADRLTGGNIFWMSFAALAVLFGHAFSIWLKFQGGKSVASFLGAFTYLAPLPMLAIAILFTVLLIWTRHLSLGSVVATGLFPIACWMILHPDWPLLVAATVAAGLIIYRHRENLARIRAGNERVFRFRR